MLFHALSQQLNDMRTSNLGTFIVSPDGYDHYKQFYKQLLDNDLTAVIKTLLKNSDLLATVWYLEMYCSCVVCICKSIAKG